MRLEIKIPDASGLVTKTNFNRKIIQIESKIPDINSLVSKPIFNTKVTDIESKIAEDNNLVTKTGSISEIGWKEYFEG